VILSQSNGLDWLLADSTGVLMTNLKRSGRDATGLSSQTLITDGQWHRVGLTWDDLRRTLLVDDVIVAEDEPGPLPIASGALCIGAGSTLDPATFWQGLIDDVRIYNRAVEP